MKFNTQKIVKVLDVDQAESQITRITLGWLGNTLDVSKSNNLYKVVCTYTSPLGDYILSRTYNVDATLGVSPVEEVEDFGGLASRHLIFQDAPYRPFGERAVVCFVNELRRFLKNNKVTSGRELLIELLGRK